jgi:hypothetical protein
MWLLVTIWSACVSLAFPDVGVGAAITGRVIDAATEEPLPLPTQGFPPVRLSLGLLSEDGRFFERVAETRCDSPEGQEKQGCVDAEGNFTFSQRFDGSPLEAGHYRLEAFAQQHFPERVEFDFDGATDKDIGDLALAPAPVEVTFDFPQPVPSTGGALRWRYRVHNLLETSLELQTYTVVDSQLSETGFFTAFQIGKKGSPTPVKLTLPPRSAKELQQEVPVPAEVSDGCCICAKIVVIEPKNPFAPLGQGGFCVSKGSGTTTPPGPPPQEPHLQGGLGQ